MTLSPRLKKDGSPDRRHAANKGSIPKHKLYANKVFSGEYEIEQLVWHYGLDGVRQMLTNLEARIIPTKRVRKTNKAKVA